MTTSGNYAAVNGLNLYYELHGEAQDRPPLVLLHGGFGSTGMFAGLIPALAKGRRLIAVDLQAHGRTADIDRPMRFESLGDDISALLAYLGIARADVLGYSMGAGAAIRTAIQHPERVNSLVVVSFPFKSAGFFPDIVAQQKQIGPQAAEAMKQSPMYQHYAQIAPKPEEWPRLVARMGELMGGEFDWTAEIRGLQSPSLLISADADMLPPAHMVEFFALLGGGQKDGGWDGSGMTKHQLALLPATTHYNILGSPLLLPVLQGFWADS